MARRLYRVEWTPDAPDDPWVTWAGSQREANAAADGKVDPEIEVMLAPVNLTDQLTFLQREADKRPRVRKSRSS